MTATRYSYHKPEDGEATVHTKTATHLLGESSDQTTHTRHRSALGDTKPNRAEKSPTNLISDNDSWKSNSKLGSSSLIRKISNEHFEKAHRKFSSDDASAGDDGDDQRGSFQSRTTESSSTRRTYSKTDSSERFESSYSTDRRGSIDESTRTATHDYSDLRASPVSGYETSSSRPVGRGDSFKDIKNKFQQATGKKS